MNKIKLILLLTIVSSNCLIFQSCDKEDYLDYRSNFFGEFNFIVITERWSFVNPGYSYDTISYLGKIREYSSNDIDNDLCVISLVDDSNEEANKKITIIFKENELITSTLTKGGQLIEKVGYHYFHQGKFIGKDAIEFTIQGLGGLGYGFSYYVKGIRN